MKTYLDCLPCFMDQALRAGRIAGADERKLKALLDEVGGMMKDISLEATPPETARLIYGKIRQITGNRDPYREIKQGNTKMALALYPFLKGYIEKSADRLLTAIRIAIAGNVIDFGVNSSFDLETEIDKILNQPFAICDYDGFRKGLNDTDDIIYIGDNAGECVFDRILIEEMKKPTTYFVREVPVINDAVLEDAVEAGIDKVATILSSGTDAPGAVVETCNDEFKEMLAGSNFVIAKGQGNYEALSMRKASVFFLLKVKCHVIAHSIGLSTGDIVLKES